MSTFKTERVARRRLPVAELHPHLMCVLCGGYYVDATTIIECLHSFCKSCLVRHLETSKYCPICEVQVHKTKPLLNIRPDETLQTMVYKLVPGLFQREMKFRQEFYAKHPEAPPSSPEDRGIVDPIECQFYSPDEPVSLSLEYKHDAVSNNNGIYKRYLRCPAAVTVAHLQKLVRNKYDLSPAHQVDVMFNDKILKPDISIMDVAYSFHRKRKEQFNFTYHILEAPCKKRKVEEIRAEAPEQMEVDPPPPTLISSLPAVPVKATSSPQPESKSKLDSIISRLGIAKKTADVLKKDKSSNEWKEVQLQISESGVMSVTDISSIDKLINSNDKNLKPSVSKSIIAQKVDAKSDEIKSDGEPKPKENCSPSLDKIGNSAKSSNHDDKEVKDIESVREIEPTKAIKHPKDDPVVKVTSDRKDDEKKLSKPELSDQKTLTPAKTCSQSKELAVMCISQQKKPIEKVSVPTISTLPSSSQSNVPSVSGIAAAASTCITSKSCTATLVTSHSIVVSAASSVSSSSSITSASKGVTKPTTSTNSALITTTPMKIAPVPIAKPAPTALPSKKSSSSPVGYKTLKCGPKNWNPTISRNSFLSSKADQQPQQQGSSSASGSGQGGPAKPATPAKFFKVRNTPRFLGNPASGVKAMYQIPESKPQTPPPAKSPSVMKLDPRTLTPIVSNAPSLTSKSSPTQPKTRPPFPSTTLSAQVSNHMPSSRVVATTTTTTSSSVTKHTDLSSLRNSPNQLLVNSFPFAHNPFLPKGMPNFMYGPGLHPTNAQFASLLSPGLGYPPVTASGYHQALPQPASILFNSHTLHRQLNPSSPCSPTGYPTSLPSPSSMSLSPPSSSVSSSSLSSKSYSAGQRTVSISEKVSIASSSQSSPSRSSRNNATVSGLGTQGSAKVNGSDQMKKPSGNEEKTSLLPSEETKAKAAASKDVETSTPSLSDNNNTLPISRAKQSEKLDPGKLPLDVSNLVSKESVKLADDQLITRPKTSSSTSVQAQQS
ncbi:polycomb group protein Psc-like [Thrips palmi]|uniref:Polycomb group protein Psc-like n=1 Tax=Thrips palmi TaxID=161013 RepID=A0A6P8ZZV8_THRPL|nr:polycomb group protein Psc-like [Thrips palmi]XP_034250992.1 polycomb group protein Psc-like [Thrips palmi]